MALVFSSRLWTLLLVIHLIERKIIQAQTQFCAGDYEITIYYQSKTFSAAKQACIAISGYLVKLDRTMFLNIKGALRSNSHYYVGAKKCGNTYCWLDGTLLSSSGSEWIPIKNAFSRGCIIFNNNKFYTVGCQYNYYYICQKIRRAPTISTANLMVTNAAPNIVLCTGKLCLPKWVKTNSGSAALKSLGVRPLSFGTHSLLIFKNAKESASGLYFCKSSKYKSSFTALNVKVHGRPLIHEIITSKCNSDVTIVWTPSEQAVTYTHVIDITNSKTILERPLAFQKQRTNITNLLPSSLYELNITTCVTSCTGNFKPLTISFVTGGNTYNVTMVTSQLTDTMSCNVTWQPANSLKNETWYKIYIKETTVIYRSNSSLQARWEINSLNTSYHLMTKPNRNYTVAVSVLTCAGEGYPTESRSSCTIPPSAPDKVATPQFQYSQLLNSPQVFVKIPNETAGLMSCLIVMIGKVSYGTSTKSIANTLYSLSDLKNRVNTETIAKEYASVALSPSRFVNVDQIQLDLGDGSISSCDLFRTSAVDGSARSNIRCDGNILCGYNRKLDNFASYKAFIIAVVPTNGMLSVSRSGDVIFNTTYRDNEVLHQRSMPIHIAGASGGALFILLLAIVAIRMKKRRVVGNITPANPGDTLQHAEPVYEVMESNSNPKVSLKEANRASCIQPVAVNMRTYENCRKSKETEESQTSISIKDLESIYNEMRKNNNRGFHEEYQRISLESSHRSDTTQVASDPLLQSKNRNLNVLPYDTTRVELYGREKGYINASFVDGYNTKKKYIATQGPLSKTVGDFWKMVLEQSTSIIIMITNITESGEENCEQYWPEEGKAKTFRFITVKNLSEISYGGYIRRIFNVSGRKKSLPVTQYHFVKWSDNKVPYTTTNFLHMHGAIMRNYAHTPNPGSIIVHCSDGAGRTGTFVGYDILMQQAVETQTVDFFGCVMKMRDNRMNMVQSSDQYAFLHKLVLESYIYGDTDLTTDEFKHKFTDLRGPATLVRLQQQYESIRNVVPLSDTNVDNLTADYIIFPGENPTALDSCSRVTVNIVVHEDKAPIFDGCWIQTEDESCPMIASCTPKKSNVYVFWRAIMDNNVGTIVMLSSPENCDTNTDAAVSYLPDNLEQKAVMKGGDIRVLKCQKRGKVTERLLEVQLFGRKSSMILFHYEFWDKEFFPTPNDVITFITQVKETARRSEKKTIFIHCDDGAGRTGMFCALVNLIDRIKSENRVDILRTVKDLREVNPTTINQQEQFYYLHEVVKHYLESHLLYSV